MKILKNSQSRKLNAEFGFLRKTQSVKKTQRENPSLMKT